MTYCRKETSLHLRHSLLYTVSGIDHTGYRQRLDKHAIGIAELSVSTAMKKGGICQMSSMAEFGKNDIKDRHQERMSSGVMFFAPRIDSRTAHIHAASRDTMLRVREINILQCRRRWLHSQ